MSIRTAGRALLGAALLLAAARPVRAQQWQNVATPSIGTSLAAAGVNSLDPTTFTTLAQTFVAPTGFLYLQNFSLFLTESFGGPDTRFRAYVYQWNADNSLGTQLWASNTFAGSGNIFGFDTYSFTTLNLQLTQLGTYAFVLSASEPFGLIPDGSTTFVGTTFDDEYAGGRLWGATNGADFAALGTAGTLQPVLGSEDISFDANFTNNTVPEPASIALLGTGLAGVALVARRRRRS
jgi:hypothetical protein